MSEREIRCYSGEVRAETHDSEPSRIIGYGSVFDSRSELIFGSFREIIRRGAFDDVLQDDVRRCLTMIPILFWGAPKRARLH
jgi:phage head maturation protease